MNEFVNEKEAIAGDQLTEFGAFLLSDAGTQMREALDAVNAYLNDA